MLSIALNCVALDPTRPIGVERFARNVLGTTSLGDADIQCLVRSSVGQLKDVLGDGFVGRHHRLRQRSLWTRGTALRILLEMFWLPLLTWRADVILSINNFGPLLGKRGQRRLVVVHDVWFMDEGYEGGAMARVFFRLLLQIQLSRSTAVVTVSDFSRREICRHFGLDASRVTVIGNCLGQQIDPAPSVDQDSLPFLLLVGSDRRNKNVKRALAGFQAHRQIHPESDLRLVVVGKYADDWTATVRREFAAIAEWLEWRGFVEDDELDRLYRASRGLVFVSLYEGFGIPAMEAVLRGRPVLLAQDTATAELIGELGVTVDGRDAAAIGQGIDTLLKAAVDTGSDAFQAFRHRHMACTDAAGRLASLVNPG